MTTTDTAVFGEDVRALAREIIARYPEGKSRSALLPMLHLVQSEQGYVTPEGIEFCAETLGIATAEVTAVATFYSMYKRQPTGEYLVSVCTNTLCGMLGGDEILEALRTELGIELNETTEDGRITLEHAECLAACDYAPVVTVNYEFFDQQSPSSAKELVRQIKGGELPMPSRGAPLCPFKQIERQLAGFRDERPEALAAGGSAGEPSLVGLRLAERGGRTDGTGEPGRDAAAEEAHEEAGTKTVPTAASGDRAETTTVTSSASSGEAHQPGGAAEKSAERAAGARERKGESGDSTGEES